VLEVGCEAGGLLRRLDEGPRVVGLDLSLSALRTARSELGTRAIDLVHADATRPLPFRDGEFDAVIASEVLEHCRSPRRIVGEIHRVLAPRGRAVFTIPNERRYLAWKEWLARFPLTRFALRGIEEGPAAWHVDHDFDRDKLLWLVDGFFEVERESSILGTTLAFVLKKTATQAGP
jgi:SAM-dependent methyltransferase